MQHEFAMSAILCIATMHLTALRPHVPKYAQMAMRMMTKSLGLFRRSLSEPFTKSNCDALLGTAILVTYMSWCDLGFLSEQHAEGLPRLDLSQDYLLLLSPGVVEVWMQAMPILINNRSVFISMIHQHPRLNIEAAVTKRGHDPARFTEQFMTIWDDPRYQTTGLPDAMEKDKQLFRMPMPRAWHLLAGLEAQFSPDHFDPSIMSHPEKDQCQLLVEALQQTVAAVDSSRAGMAGCPFAAASATDSMSTGALVTSNTHQVDKKAFREIVRKLSPLLSCITPPSVLLNPPASLEADMERLIYALPILCCGPNAKLAMKGDSRALVVLFHLYHVASVLLNKERGWWAGARGGKLKDAIREELKSRGLGVCLRK